MKSRVLAACALLAGACTYAWPMGPPAGDGGGGEGGKLDGGGDDRVEPGDASADAPGNDVSSDSGLTCTDLGRNVDAAQKAAKICDAAMVGACSAAVLDECGCKVWVGSGTSAATQDFKAALTAFENGGCHSPCPVTCTVQDGSTSGFCLPDQIPGQTACSP